MNPPTTIVEHPADLIPAIAAARAAQNRTEAAKPQRRVLIIGRSGTGKTYNVCTTFPKVIVLDYDNQLNDDAVRSKVAGIYPMWDKAWVSDKLKAPGTALLAHKALLTSKDIAALDHTYTVFVDSFNQFGDEISEKLKDQTPKGDQYWYWREWAKALREVHNLYKQLRCNVVVSMIEEEVRDAETGRVEAVRMNMQGREFTPRMPSFYTDVFRQVKKVTPKPPDDATIEYLWQIHPNNDFSMAKSRIKTTKMFVPSTWASLQ